VEAAHLFRNGHVLFHLDKVAGAVSHGARHIEPAAKLHMPSVLSQKFAGFGMTKCAKVPSVLRGGLNAICPKGSTNCFDR
jgi:hypothetical protein